MTRNVLIQPEMSDWAVEYRVQSAMTGMSYASFLILLAPTRFPAHSADDGRAVSASVRIGRSIDLSVWRLPNSLPSQFRSFFAAVVYHRLMHCHAYGCDAFRCIFR